MLLELDHSDSVVPLCLHCYYYGCDFDYCWVYVARLSLLLVEGFYFRYCPPLKDY